MLELPQIKKKISDFLINEEGSISKKNLVLVGTVLVGASVVAEARTEITYSEGQIVGTHIPEVGVGGGGCEGGCGGSGGSSSSDGCEAGGDGGGDGGSAGGSGGGGGGGSGK